MLSRLSRDRGSQALLLPRAVFVPWTRLVLFIQTSNPASVYSHGPWRSCFTASLQFAWFALLVSPACSPRSLWTTERVFKRGHRWKIWVRFCFSRV